MRFYTKICALIREGSFGFATGIFFGFSIVMLINWFIGRYSSIEALYYVAVIVYPLSIGVLTSMFVLIELLGEFEACIKIRKNKNTV